MKKFKIAIAALALFLLLVTTVSAQAQYMVMDADVLSKVAVGVFLASVAEFLVDGLVTPIFDKFKADKFWLKYIAWGVASCIIWLSGVNLLDAEIPNAFAGQVITAILCGGGSNKIHDVFDRFVSKKEKKI